MIFFMHILFDLFLPLYHFLLLHCLPTGPLNVWSSLCPLIIFSNPCSIKVFTSPDPWASLLFSGYNCYYPYVLPPEYTYLTADRIHVQFCLFVPSIPHLKWCFLVPSVFLQISLLLFFHYFNIFHNWIQTQTHFHYLLICLWISG